MNMSYSNNPNMGQVRRQAVLKLRQGWSTRQVARYFGYSQSAIVKWAARAPADGRVVIPTRSSRPRSHPKALPPEVVQAIIQERLKIKRCSEVVYDNLREQDIKVSLSSVKRTLKRHELLKDRTKWRRERIRVPRPLPAYPGALVQMDTIHIVDWETGKRFYIYVVLDVCSRWAYAEVYDKLRSNTALAVVLQAQIKAGFSFQVLQTDNGPEFAVWFRNMLASKGMVLRHSRVRTPNDNAHIERFNRTLQDECLGKYPLRRHTTQAKINAYLNHYNNDRKHMGLGLKTPAQVIPSY
jgi:transposase InsO family protein